MVVACALRLAFRLVSTLTQDKLLLKSGQVPEYPVRVQVCFL